MQNSKRPHCAVLIDGDNVPAKYGEAIFDEITSLGEASIRRIYGDFSNGPPQGWEKSKLMSLALIPHQQFAGRKGKNATDIALVIDAMDILHSGRLNVFILISSDGDYARLASRIREQGIDVYGMGEKKTPESFRNACKRFIYLENLSISENGNESGETPRKTLPPSKARPLVEAAMRSIEPEAEWIGLSPLGSQINAANSDFDPRSYGCKNLSTLLEKAGKFEIRKGGGSLEVRRKS